MPLPPCPPSDLSTAMARLRAQHPDLHPIAPDEPMERSLQRLEHNVRQDLAGHFPEIAATLTVERCRSRGRSPAWTTKVSLIWSNLSSTSDEVMLSRLARHLDQRWMSTPPKRSRSSTVSSRPVLLHDDPAHPLFGDLFGRIDHLVMTPQPPSLEQRVAYEQALLRQAMNGRGNAPAPGSRPHRL